MKTLRVAQKEMYGQRYDALNISYGENLMRSTKPENGLKTAELKSVILVGRNWVNDSTQPIS